MAKEIQKVKLKNGQSMNYFKSDGKHVFFNNMMTVSTWQLVLLVFIIVLSIILGVFQVMVTVDVGNRLLEAMKYCVADQMILT